MIARIPHGDANVIKVPENVADEDALYVSDILVTSYHQVMDTGVKEGDCVAIWGAGAIGMVSTNLTACTLSSTNSAFPFIDVREMVSPQESQACDCHR